MQDPNNCYIFLIQNYIISVKPNLETRFCDNYNHLNKKWRLNQAIIYGNMCEGQLRAIQ